MDVEGDGGFRVQCYGVERGDEKARDHGQSVRVILLDLWWRGRDLLVPQGGGWIDLVLLGEGRGYD